MLINTCSLQCELGGGLVSRCVGSVDKFVSVNVYCYCWPDTGLHPRDVGPPHQTTFGPRKKIYSST